MQAKISSVQHESSKRVIPTLTLFCETDEEFTMASLYLQVYQSGGAVMTEIIGPKQEKAAPKKANGENNDAQ